MRTSPLPADLQLLRDRDPRLRDSRLSAADLFPVEEEMLDLGLDPSVVDPETYLEARAKWQADRLPFHRLAEESRRLQAIRDENRATILASPSMRS